MLHFDGSGCSVPKATLTPEPSAYPPSRICGLLESLVTPNTSGIKSPLKLKMEHNVSTTSATTGVQTTCSYINLYLHIFPPSHEELSAVSLLWILALVWVAGSSKGLSAFHTMPVLWLSRSTSPLLLFSISHTGEHILKGIFALFGKPVRLLLYKIYWEMTAFFPEYSEYRNERN